MSIKQIFDTMEYGPAPESTARRWPGSRPAADRRALHQRRMGSRRADDFESRNPATGERLAGDTRCTSDEVAGAVAAARAALPAWEALRRARPGPHPVRHRAR